MAYYKTASPDEWRLIQGRSKGVLEEIKLIEIPEYNTSGFWSAWRFWYWTKKHGIPLKDWRLLTIAQINVLDLFDNLDSLRVV
jgi:hypothetical protein